LLILCTIAKALSGCTADAAIATGKKCNSSIKITRSVSPLSFLLFSRIRNDVNFKIHSMNPQDAAVQLLYKIMGGVIP
jgi:hypothetical protein